MKRLLLERAKNLRIKQTNVERLIWQHLRGRRFSNFKFRRQVPIGNYILDFVCLEKRFIIEIDGGQHCEQIFYDNERTVWLDSQGFQLARYWNNEVLFQLDAVMDDIFLKLNSLL